MKKIFSYNKKTMTLQISIGKYCKYLQCPFATWWKARKYFKMPKFIFYFGPCFKKYGKKETQFGEYIDFRQKGFWPFASTEYLKRTTSKWFPIHIVSSDIMWKDKYDSPRYEHPGYFVIFFGRDYHKHWQFSMIVTAPKTLCCNDCTKVDNPDNYWECILNYLYYYDKYNEKENKQDIVLARNYDKINHWRTAEYTHITDFKIVGFGEETLSLGNNKHQTFTYIDITSDMLYDKIYENSSICFSDLRNDISVSVNNYIQNETLVNRSKVFLSSRYIKSEFVYNKDDKPIIRMFYNDEQQKLLNYLSLDEHPIELTIANYIDLGPVFKDEFLNNKGQEKIQSIMKK